MTWRSRSLRVVPIAFPLLLPPDGAWARGRGHAHGHYHDHHHPSHHHVFGFGHPCGYASCGCGWSVGCGHTLAPGSPQSSAKKTPAARGPPADKRRDRCPSSLRWPRPTSGRTTRPNLSRWRARRLPCFCGPGLQMRRLLGSADAPESAECPHGSLMPGLTMQRAVGRVDVRVTSLTLVAYCLVQGRMSNAKIHGLRTGNSGQDPKADHGTAIGSREASDPNALRSGRAG